MAQIYLGFGFGTMVAVTRPIKPPKFPISKFLDEK
jgi:hypothetical protein